MDTPKNSKRSLLYSFSLIALLVASFLVGRVLGVSQIKATPPKEVVVNNNGLAWGFDGVNLPKNPCGVEYELKEVRMLGNTINLNNCPRGEAFIRNLSTPYQMSSVIYQGYYEKFERKPWLTTIRSAFHAYMDKYDYLKPGVAFFYFDKDDYSSLYINVSSLGVESCIGPNEDYVHENGNIYIIKGNQQVATSITDGKCEERIAKAQSYKFEIKTRE